MTYFDFNVNLRIWRFPNMKRMVAARIIVASIVMMIGPERFVNISKLFLRFSILFLGSLHFEFVFIPMIHSALERCELEDCEY